MKNQNSLVSFNKYLTNDKTQDYLQQVLGSRKESFVTNCVALVSNNVSLQKCTPNTVMYSAIKATSLGLPLDNNLGFAYVLPYNNNKLNIQEAQFQLGYKGFIQLAMRSGQFKTINASDVREGEIEKINRLTGEISFNWKDNREGINVIGYVAYMRLNNGFEKSVYMTVEELKKHGQKYSKSYNTNFSNWKNMFEAMATKTVIKQLLSKYAPLSIQMQDAVKYDQAIIQDPNNFEYTDNDNTIDIEAESLEEENERIMNFISKSDTIEALDGVKNSLDKEQLKMFKNEILEAENRIVFDSKTA